MRNEFTNVGNHPALNFLNTRIIKKNQRIELLKSFADLESWLTFFEVLPYIEDLTSLNEHDKSLLLEEVLEVRNKLEELVEILTLGQLPDQFWLNYINNKLQQHSGYDQLIRNEGKIRIEHYYSAKNLVGYFVLQTVLLLHDIDHSRIKKCSNEKCLIYFYDNSRNASRRWCDVSTCGNRANANKHYHRKKEAKSR